MSEINQMERDLLRDLAKRYMDVCRRASQNKKRDLWESHNSLIPTRPPIYVRAFAWNEMPQSECVCEDRFLRPYENFFRKNLFHSTLGDDYIFEPWVTVGAKHKCSGWGVQVDKTHSDASHGSFKVNYPIREESDLEKLRMPWHEIDEKATEEAAERLDDAIGDIIPINIDRGPAYRMWSGDISTDLGYLRGIEHFMMDMAVNPEWMHRFASFLSQGILKTHNEAEEKGDWGLCAHQNQAMPYARELPRPAANVNGVQREVLWGYMAAQECTGISPQMHDEFILQYQMPIMKHFGLIAYGCCEDLTNKIDMLRQIPNLRRIAVSPFADVEKCAEQIGTDYVISYRPSPSDMVGYGLDKRRIESILGHALEVCRGCHMDITLKDVETVQEDVTRIRKWVAIARNIIDKHF